MVPEVCRQVLLKNPGSVAQWLRSPVDGTFVGVCVAFKALLNGFHAGCRPVIGLDGCHMKGKFGGITLSLVAIDGNNGLFPIGIYLCRGETRENYETFLRILKPHLIKHNQPLTFMSDMSKGIIEAVKDVFPSSYHRFCFRHMYV